ncbi:hypothetical protein DPMN_130016 [Dreissena polymorpha]|uniref:Uncharacterized protein n=1 Tax=Dreissena polymorpha TaxID=45954 RepID=A0A9D4JXZ9_DREPO|nr:hypothetical protein DPMN_130016 [Dreissena polymorpha]
MPYASSVAPDLPWALCHMRPALLKICLGSYATCVQCSSRSALGHMSHASSVAPDLHKIICHMRQV